MKKNNNLILKKIEKIMKNFIITKRLKLKLKYICACIFPTKEQFFKRNLIYCEKF